MVKELKRDRDFSRMELATVRAFPLFLLIFSLSACEVLNTATVTGEFHPGISGSVKRTAFTQSWPFDFNTTASYAYDTTKIDFTGGVCRLTAANQVDKDNTASGFAGGTLVGAAWDGTNSYVRLSQTGTPKNNAELDVSWTPQWGSLVSYWKMNGDWSDSLGGNNGTSIGTPSFSSSSKVGAQAGVFNGTGDYLTVNHSGALSMTTKWTITAWVFLSADTGTQYPAILTTEYPGVDSKINYTLGFDSGRLPNTGFYNGAWYRAIASNPISLNQWHHLAGVYSGSAGTLTLYVDGIVAATVTGTPSSIPATTSRKLIGRRWDYAEYIPGKIDDLAIWNTDLNGVEVQTIYSRQSANYSGTLTSRVMDALAIGQSWTTFSWIPTLPFMKELPDYASGAIQNESSVDYSSLVGSTGSTGDNNLMSGIIGLWHLDGAIGNIANGATVKAVYGPDGTVVDGGGAAPQYSTSLLGQGIQLDGVNDYVSIADSANFSNLSQISLSAWVNFKSLSGGTVIITKNPNLAGTGPTDPYENWMLIIDSSGHPTFILSAGTPGTRRTLIAANTIQANQWAHIAGTYDGVTMRIYINGVADANTITASFIVGTSAALPVIGAYLVSGYYLYTPAIIDEIAIWNRSLHANEILQLYRRGANRVKHQVRVCALNDCSDDATGANWKGPDGTNQTYFSELNNNTVPLDGSGAVKKTLPSMLFSNFTSPVSTSRYFQYRTILESDDTGTGCNYGSGATWCSPELKSVTVDPVHYDTSSPTVVGKTGVSFYSLASFTETLGVSCASGIGYNLGVGSTYSATTWYYWNGSAWATANGTAAQSNTAAVISTNSASFSGVAGTGTVYFKAFLKSSGTSQCELDQLDLTGQQ